MREKTEKRLVSKKEYLRTRLQKGGLYSTAVVVGCFGVGFLIATISFLVEGARSWDGNSGMILFLMFNSLIMGAICVAALWYSKIALKSARKIAPVGLITRHNTGQLPAVETLVRPSSLPVSHQQVELLRGVTTPGSETSPNEMLRASVTGGTDGPER